MHNVLIVDDEPIICGAVSRFLLRSDLGIGRVETALNGFEALDYLRLEKFDLVITDIQMGGMNGIELMEIIFSEHSDLPVVVISAHEDFHYAQQALRLGAWDYLIKPVKSEHLQRVIGEVLSRKRSDSLHRWEADIRSKYAVEQLITMKSVLLNEWLRDERQEWTTAEIEGVLDDIGVALPGPRYCVMTAELDLDEGGVRRNTRFGVKDRKLLLFAALNVIQESMAGWEACAFYGFGGHLVMIVSLGGAGPEREGREELTQVHLIARTVQANLSTYLNLHNWIGISRTARCLTDIPALYRETREALDTKRGDLLGLPVYYVGDVERHIDNLMVHWQQRLEALVKELQQRSEPDEAEKAIHSLLKDLDSMGVPEERRPNCLLQAAYCIYGMLSEFREVWEELALPPEPQAVAALFTSRERADEAREYLEKIAVSVTAGNKHSEHSTVLKAMDYIKRNYSNKGLKLQDVAREVHLSPNYFSYLFKKTTDRNLWDYLTEIRMDEAKKLLLHSDKRRYEIAEMIGYESPEHFSRVFKKFYGISPADCRK